VEIERKFLVEREPDWLAERPSEDIEQGYLTDSDASVQVRIRRVGGGAILGVKRGTGRVREETEVELAPEQAERLWPLTKGRRVSKARYRVEEPGMTIEVDVYRGELDGLSVAEVEFSSEDDADAFEAPGWLGRELTGEREFDNDMLAERGLPKGRS
jgi:CYTH domain-containing protein